MHKLSARHVGLFALAVVVAIVGVYIDPATATAGVMILANAPLVLPAEEMKKLEEALAKKAGEVVETVQKALRDEMEKYKTLTGETNEKIGDAHEQAKKMQTEMVEFKQRMLEVEQKLAKKPGAGEPEQVKSPGQIFAESESLQLAVKANRKGSDPVMVGALHKTNIINIIGQNQPLVPDQRLPGIIIPSANRRLTIRDLVPNLRTDSNLVQYPKENVFTNAAALQFGSPDSKEGVSKAESAITFTLANAAVETIAHFIPASRQILADAPGLAGYIDARLMYGLKLVEETQMLTGDGTSGNLSGLNTNATAYNRGVSNDTMLDCLLKMILQVALSEYTATGMVLNPQDWFQIRLLKDTTGRYLIGAPQEGAEPKLWGLPVVATNSQTQGTALVGAFELAAAIFDREDAMIRLSEHHSSFFVQNLVAILCEERLAFAIFRALSFVKATLPALGT